MSLRRPSPRRVAVAALVWAAAACGGETAPETAPEATLEGGPQARTGLAADAFVDLYVDLRVAALSSPEGQSTDEERQAILDRHGVTEEALLAFAEARGTDPAYMQEVWNRVEARLEEIRGDAYDASAPTDAAPDGGPPPEPRIPGRPGQPGEADDATGGNGG